VIIRDGKVLFDRPKKATSTVYPPLDVMALYPDGTVSLHKNATVTSEELLAAGATDSLSFGPILVENGEVSPRSTEFGNTPNPRTAWGVVEPGHYIAVVVESRIAESKGEGCVWLGQKMAELGCTSAINLDGGATSVMMFMGHQINKSGNYGDITNRRQNELFGIGHSDNII
jgi:exopolysaccharide biosynthesis protein